MNASYPAQAPTTADNAINALGNLPAGNDFAQPHLNAEGSEEPASNDPTQHPTLHPFVQHDAVNAAVNPSVGNENIIVGDYHIEGVADIIGVESRRHVTAFYKATIPLIENASQANPLMIKSKFELIKEALLRNREGNESIAELRSEYPQIYKWNKAFAVVVNGDSTVVVARPPDIIGQEAIDINFVKRITYFEHAFSDIRRAHGEDHAKGRTLYGRVCERIDNIGRIFCKMFTDLCPICIQRQLRNRPIAGLRPIVTFGFGTRGQIDLIDFQSMPDGSFRFLLIILTTE
jgi:hypothetical protein